MSNKYLVNTKEALADPQRLVDKILNDIQSKCPTNVWLQVAAHQGSERGAVEDMMQRRPGIVVSPIVYLVSAPKLPKASTSKEMSRTGKLELALWQSVPLENTLNRAAGALGQPRKWPPSWSGSSSRRG